MLTQEQFSKELTIGRICYFKSDQISSPEPHYLCIHHSFKTYYYFVCATTQIDNRRRAFAINGYPESCLVEIPATNTNQLKFTSWYDCNSYQFHDLDELWELYSSSRLTLKGFLTQNELTLIRRGLHDSEEIEESMKDIFPKE